VTRPSPGGADRASISGVFHLVPGGTAAPFVDEVFEAVVDLPAEEREAHLRRLCAGHPEVEVEVRSLLSAVEAVPLARREPAPGDRLGPYRLEEQLGQGSSGGVWKAFDEHLQAWTALKVFRARPEDDALELVLREARAASAILSDYVVRVKGAGKFQDGPYYLEMQLCAEYRPGPDGERLVVGRTLAEDPPRTIDEAVRMVAEAARGVEDAHRIGVVHRDVKPSNILVLPASRRALVTDFGLAAPGMQPPPSIGTPPTATVTLVAEGGKIVGTPAFMAPEQAGGSPLGRSSDVYGLGATLYALLAGRPPYLPTGLDPIPAIDVIKQVRAGPPAPLPALVPRRLDAVIAKAMARNPAERYPTAAALAADLEAWRASRATSVDRRTPWLAVGLFAQRNREVVGTAAGMAVLLLMSTLALGVLENRREFLEQAAANAETRRLEAEGQAERADDVRQQAEEQRDRAIADAAAAQEARELALAGQDEATRQATEAFQARQAAEDAQRAAEVARRRAEVAAATEVALRKAAESDLTDSIEARMSAEAALQAAIEARGRAEADRDHAEELLRSKMAEIDALRSALAEGDGAAPLPGVE
jgi:serine/threonine-protein kinase